MEQWEHVLSDIQTGMVIGKEGRNIKFIQKQSGARINIDKNGRKIVVKGDKEAVLKAKQFIHSAMYGGILFYPRKINLDSQVLDDIGSGTNTDIRVWHEGDGWIRIIILAIQKNAEVVDARRRICEHVDRAESDKGRKEDKKKKKARNTIVVHY